jgi:hypothetical protein
MHHRIKIYELKNKLAKKNNEHRNKYATYYNKLENTEQLLTAISEAAKQISQEQATSEQLTKLL